MNLKTITLTTCLALLSAAPALAQEKAAAEGQTFRLREGVTACVLI